MKEGRPSMDMGAEYQMLKEHTGSRTIEIA